jgi:hypothetical protein
MKHLGRIVIFLLFLFVVSCDNDNNYIYVNFEDRKNLRILVNEIYQNAENNDIDYFKHIVGKECKIDERFYETDEDKKQYLDLLRKRYNKQEFTDIKILDWYTTEETKDLMELIVRANIKNNYKKRTKINMDKNRINLNYHWDSKEIYFQIYIEKNKNGEWEMVELWKCR